MAEKIGKPFNDGSGSAYFEPGSATGDSPMVVTADAACGEDRELTLTVTALGGSLSDSSVIRQEGLREQFIGADATEGFSGSDCEPFLGIKDKYAGNIPDGCR